ncbi:MAG TPA: class I SAM-dependent methyltransferase [Planctomycetaceae bacterium]|nr:class I SAM-dependent methyltransferase [Planctomycetaceae bacterium]
MDTPEEARDYNEMDHSEVNRAFVRDFLEFCQQVQPGGTPRNLLDVGTGTALIPLEYCRQVPTGSITAIDLAREMLTLAERNVTRAGLSDRISLRLCDSKQLPFADGQFDAVISNSIIHHIPEPIECLRETARVLAPGGLLFVRDLLRPASAEAVEGFVQQYAGEENPHSQQMFRQSLLAALTVDEVRNLLTELQLPSGWVKQTSDRHWTIAGCQPPDSA